MASCAVVNDHAFDRESIERIRREPNERARTALIGGFLRQKEGLIRHLARKAAAAEKTELDLEDILQAGRIGMLKAMDTWDPNRGSIATWAGWKIKRCVQDAAHANQAIALPQIRGTTADRNRIVLAVRENPDVTAAELGIKPGMLERVKKTIGLRYVSVDMFGDGDDAPARQRKIERRITDSTEQDDADDVLDVRRAIERATEAFISGAKIVGIAVEDFWTGLGIRLGCSPVDMAAKNPSKKVKEKCPTPKVQSKLRTRRIRLVRLRPLPLPRLARAAVASRKRPRALPLRPCVRRPLPRSHLRAIPFATISNVVSLSPKRSASSPPTFAPSSSSALRSAA